MSENMTTIKEKVLDVVRKRNGAPVSVAEIAAELLLPTDVVYRAATLLVQDRAVEVVEEVAERELQLEAVGG